MLRGCRSVVPLLALLALPALLYWKWLPGRSGSTPIAVRAEAAHAASTKTIATPRLVVQLGHARNILSVAYAPDGQTALTGSEDQTARLWDIVTSREIRRFDGHTDAVQSVAISVDGQTVLTGSSDKTARLWNTSTGAEIRRFEHPAAVTSVVYSPDGEQILTGSHDRKARLWDAPTGRLVREFEGHSGSVLAVAFSADGRQILTGGGDNTARLWDADSARVLQELKGHSEPISSVAFAPEGTKLLTGSFDRSARFWDAQTGDELQVYRAPRRILSAVFSPDGQQVITGNEGYPVKLDDEQGNTVRVWDTQTGKQLRGFRDYGSSAASVAVSRDGKRVLVGAGHALFLNDDGRAQIWDIDTGSHLRMLEGQGVLSVECVACSDDGRWLLVGSDDGAAWLWDAATGREVHRFEHNEGSVRAVALSGDGRTVLTGGNDCTARLWDAASGKELRRLEGHASGVASVALSPDGRSVLTGSTDSTARLWDVATGKEVCRLVEYTGRTEFVIPLFCAVAFSPDGRSMLTAQWDNTARLWDTASRKELQCFQGHGDRVVSVAFSPDGKQVLTGSWDKTARLWDVKTGTELRSLAGHFGAVSSVAISGDGIRILTGSWDNTARLWDAQTGAELRSFPGHARSGQSVAFAADGTRAVMANLDKTAVLWNLETQQQLCTLIHSSGGTVAATPEGNYMAPKGALKSVAFGIGNRALPFDQFDLKFNRPDLVLARIGLAPAELIGAYRAGYQKRIAKLGFTEEGLSGDLHVPQTAILSESPLVTSEPSLTLTVRASDTQCPLDRLNVDVNGVPVYGIEGIPLRERNLADWQQDIKIELSTGKNTIQISAINVQGAESIRDTFEIRCDATAKAPELYVVAVGVSDYRDRRCRLTYARKDAQDLAALLKSKADRFGRVHVAKFLDREATRDKILNVKKLLLQSSVNDEVVIFLAGHGLLDERLDYYFATADLDFEDPSRAGLSYAAIENLLDGIPARKKLLLMDTCHSGEVEKVDLDKVGLDKLGLDSATADVTAGALPHMMVKTRNYRGRRPLKSSPLDANNSRRLLEEMFADLRRGTGAVVISAAGGAEFAIESPKWRNGVFTYAVLDGLKTAKADVSGDGQVQVSELRDYVMDVVPRLTRGRQIPTARRENLTIDFPVY
jgi:WD40 repeat protein